MDFFYIVIKKFAQIVRRNHFGFLNFPRLTRIRNESQAVPLKFTTKNYSQRDLPVIYIAKQIILLFCDFIEKKY